MMNERIPLKIRLIAAGIHAVNTIVNMFSGLLFLSNINELTKIPAMPGLGTTGIASTAKQEIWKAPVPLFIAVITIFIIWRITKEIHPFVNRSGRYATNHTLNCLVMPFFVFAFVALIWYTTCGITPTDQFNFLILVPASFVYGLVSIAYFLNSIVAGIFTLRGYDFNSGLIIPFVHSE
jgi:uncharacterized Tic20 family protein